MNEIPTHMDLEVVGSNPQTVVGKYGRQEINIVAKLKRLSNNLKSLPRPVLVLAHPRWANVAANRSCPRSSSSG